MPGRRLSGVFVALLVIPVPACLHIGPVSSVPQDNPPATTKTTTTKATEPRMEFAVLPRVPGTVVHAKQLPQPVQGTKTAQKQESPLQILPSDPKLLQPIGVEPGPFPLPQVTPPPEPPLLAAMRAYTENRPDRAIEIIRTMDKQNQDFVLAVLPILARGATADLTNDPATIAMLIDQLHAAAFRLEPRAALRIEHLTLCNDVFGFGRFTPRAPNEPYRPNSQAQLYLELKNLASRPSDREFITHVHATVEVRDAHQKLVEQIDWEDYKRRVPIVRFNKRLVSHSPLRDFHVLYIFSVPATPGVYTITIELRDAATGRVVKTPPTQFCVAGP